MNNAHNHLAAIELPTSPTLLFETAKMPTQRLIDQLDRPRKKPMRVLVLGVSRTGTSSIMQALQTLGYTPFHMMQIHRDNSQIPYWHEAINVTFLPDSSRPAHQRGAPPYGREELDKLLAEYDAVTDWPAALFVEQLVEAYPEAKVVLTRRGYESWERSMRESIWLHFTRPIPVLCRVFNISPHAPLLRMVHAVFKVHNGNAYGGPQAREAFEKHYELVRSVVPREKLLEFGPVFEWEPLCEFLGEEVPDVPYPWSNEGKVMRERIDGLQWNMANYLLGTVVMPLGVVGVAWGVWWWKRMGL